MRKKYLFVILGILAVGMPVFVFADGLVPCGGPNETACSLCDLYVLAQNILNFLMWEATPIIAVFAFSWAGFKILISGPNPGLRNEGFGIIRKTIIGMLIVFSSWIIINELLLFFASPAGSTVGTVLSNPWNKVNCALPAPTVAALNPAFDGPNAPAAQALPRQTLAAAGINANTNYCMYFGPPNQTSPCTTLAQLPQNATSGLTNLKTNCACTVYITGGTEIIGHKTHGPGKPIVDVQKNATLDSYIQSIGGTPQSTSLGPLYTDTQGNTYLDEIPQNGQGAHWHIVFA